MALLDGIQHNTIIMLVSTSLVWGMVHGVHPRRRNGESTNGITLMSIWIRCKVMPRM